jgi:hypothetical protein
MKRLAFAALGALFACACTYAWPTGAPVADGGGEAGRFDATTDGSGVDGAGDAAPSDVTSDATPDCRVLGADVEAKKKAAKVCTPTAGACSSGVTDECGCKVWVGDETGAATSDLQNALAAYESAKCKPACPVSCIVPDGATTGLCVLASGGGTACAP